MKKATGAIIMQDVLNTLSGSFPTITGSNAVNTVAAVTTKLERIETATAADLDLIIVYS